MPGIEVIGKVPAGLRARNPGVKASSPSGSPCRNVLCPMLLTGRHSAALAGAASVEGVPPAGA